jgi:IS605 OrfB family transposase
MILIDRMITYNAKLLGDTDELKKLLQMEQLVYNIASKEQFPEKTKSLVILHSKVYKNVRKSHPNIPSQVIIKAEQEVLAGYRSIKSNKHKITKPIVKTNLSIRLDKRLYSLPDKFSIRITTTGKRQTYKFVVYPRLKELLKKYPFQDPLIYENNGNIYICLSFENKQPQLKQRLALGIDLGIRRSAATSDGRLIIDKSFNERKRKLRHLKDILKTKGTKSARRKLRYKLKRKERNQNDNQTHLIANEVLKTEADTICLENLKSIKRKKNPYQNKHSISQVPLYELRRVITYKAENMGKTIVLVCPYNTSKTDSTTGKVEGERRGCRFYSNNGLIYDADINAAINIAKISKLPISQTKYLTYGQVSVNRPNEYKSLTSVRVVQAPTL